MAENFLSQDEVDALMNGMNGIEEEDDKEESQESVRQYNMATQERIVRGRMPTLELINERFARLLRVGLFNYLRRTAEISVGPLKIAKYTDFVRNLVVPTNLNMVQIKPLRGTMLMVLDPSLVFMIVDNMFGGDGRFHTRIEGREFTGTEHKIIKNVLDIIFENYQKSWEPVYPVEFEFMRSEMNTQFANIATPNEVVVTMSFNIEIGTVSGTIHFCIPYSTVEPLREVLTSPLQGEVLGIDTRWVNLMTEQIQDAEVEIVANLGTAKMSLADIMKMKVGDIFPVTIPKEIEAKIDNVPVASCSYGAANGQYALRVNKLLKSNSKEYIKGESNGG